MTPAWVEAEEWRPVVGYELSYEVSNMGRVRSLRYWSWNRRVVRRTPKMLSPCVDSGGRWAIAFANGYPPLRMMIHKVVLTAFVGPRPDGMECAHLNGDPSDNRLVNLAWVSHAENESHKVRHGTLRFGDASPVAKLTAIDAEEIRCRYAHGALQRELAADFGVSKSTISDIVCGHRWVGPKPRPFAWPADRRIHGG